MTAPWLVALDVDGTILLQDETMSPGVPEAVARLRDAGHVVTIATGRSWMATRRYVEQLELDAEYVVCSNGAVTMRRVGDDWERWNVETFDPSPALALLRERLPDARYMVELASGQRLFTDQLDDWTLDGGRRVSFEELAAEPVSRIVVVSPGHDEEDFHRLVADAGLNEVSYAIGWTAWLDIAPQESTRAPRWSACAKSSASSGSACSSRVTGATTSACSAGRARSAGARSAWGRRRPK